MTRSLLLALALAVQLPLRAIEKAPPQIVFSDGKAISASGSDSAVNYQNTLVKIHAERIELLHKYQAARGDAARQSIIVDSRQYLLTSLVRDLLPAWYGTPWAFEGVSQTPGQGQIACGYFVTTTLRDAGFDLPRVRLAQQASQVIIRSLCDPDTIKLYYAKPMSEINAYLERNGPGIYIVGLDCHTGFVVHDGTKKAFIHSSYFTPPRAVCADPLENHNPLTQSKYRMIGKLLSDSQIIQWLTGEPMPMKTQ